MEGRWYSWKKGKEWERVNFNLVLTKGICQVSLVAQMVKNLPAMKETPVWFPSQENPLEKGMATSCSILGWRIPWTDHGVTKSRTWLSDFHFHKGTCHLPLQGLTHELLQLLTFNIPWREFRVGGEQKWGTPGFGKTWRIGLHIVRHYQELILWVQFLHLLTSRKALNSFMVTSAPHD